MWAGTTGNGGLGGIMRAKIRQWWPFAVLGAVFGGLVVLNMSCHDHWLDSDMAAEMIFSRLLAESGHVFATEEWYYSTEFRFLYTQLVMAPLFRLSQDWHLIRMITNIVTYVLMLASYFYMMKPLKVDRRWVALTGAVLLLPFSETMMTHMQMGNTYMPHVILLFFYLGLFLRLVQKVAYPRWRRREMAAVYLLLSVICGVSGVRYLLAMQCPLAIAALLYLAFSGEWKQFRRQFGTDTGKKSFRQVWKSGRAAYLYCGLLGAGGSLLGYCLNVLWVSRQYVFQTYEATNFIPVYQGILAERVQNALGSLLMLFGYIPDRGFLSLRGFITMLSFVAIALLVYCGAKVYRGSCGQKFFVALFLAVSLGLNLFVFVFTTSTMVPRYYITTLIFALPVLAFYMEGREPAFDRLAVSLLLACCFLMGTAKVTLSYLSADKNQGKRAVAAFLEENGYDFGFATYWNANIMTELTDGAVEIANIGDPEYLEFFKWSSPMRYYEEGYHQGETFLLLTAEQRAEYAGAEALQAGEVVYEDGDYTVYVYESVEELMACAAQRD